MSQPRKKILILCPQTSHYSGVAHAILDNCRHFTDPRLEIHLYLPNRGDLDEDLHKLPHIHVTTDRFFPPALLHNVFPWRNLFTTGVSVMINLIRSLFLIFRLAHFLQRKDFSLIVANCLWPKCFSPFISLLSGTPLVWHSRRDRKSDFYFSWARFWIREGILKKILILSKPVQDSLDPELARISVLIPDGIDIPALTTHQKNRVLLRQEYRIPTNARVIGIVGRIVPEKGIREYCKAMQQLIQTHHDVYGLIIGTTPMAESTDHLGLWKKWVEEEQLSQRLFFTGFLKDAWSFFSVLDILAHPSHTDLFPRAVLEAMALEIPVVGSEVGGLVEMIAPDEKYGLFCKPQNPESLVQAIEKILGNPGQARNMTRNARTHIETEYASPLMAEKLERLFLELMSLCIKKTDYCSFPVESSL